MFLESFDFASDSSGDINEGNKYLINASVLGRIFEKINGYKEGSYFTPGFITMYMAKETIKSAVLDKFNAIKGWNCNTIDELKGLIEDRKEANKIVNSLKICDPAVGSGHFLVSVLNEILAIKSYLNILCYKDGTRIRYYKVEVANDELTVFDEEAGEIFEYVVNKNGVPAEEKQKLQETLFHEKETIIENCLFGVDVNPNSVNICRLRLWIELLKNAYYIQNSFSKNKGNDLQTLPNIDINIKVGNSLISRFDLTDDYSKMPMIVQQKIKLASQKYKDQVFIYKNTTDKQTRNNASIEIKNLKIIFSGISNPSDKDYILLTKKESELGEIPLLFDRKDKDEYDKKVAILSSEVEDLRKKCEVKRKMIYGNAFEWRFEFPEVLDEEGRFIGFDVIIGNPPYIQLQNLKNESKYFESAKFKTYHRMADVYCIFYELGTQILKSTGILSYITSNKFIKSNYGLNLRKYLSPFEITQIIDFGELPVFENASTFPSIVSLKKTNKFGCTNYTQVNHLKFESLLEYSNSNSIKLNENTLKNNNWIIVNDRESILIDKLKNKSKTLAAYTKGEILFGIKTGYNEAYIIDEETHKKFIQDDPKSSEIIRPFVNGEDVRKFKINWKKSFIILAKTGIDLTKYPAILQHMEKYHEKLEKRSDKGINWWDLRRCSYYHLFELPKILYPDIALESRFTIDKSGFVPNATLFCIPTEDYFLLGLLNSKLAWYYLKKVCPVLGDINKRGRLRLKTIYLQNLPVRFDSSIAKGIENLVKKILQPNKVVRDNSKIENQIDELVYQLYEISEEEKLIIEGKE
jgi:type II restriction/modification system DNA methylase subunit YeeA